MQAKIVQQRLMRGLAILVAIAASVVQAADNSNADAVAIVTDLSGTAETQNESARANVAVLTEFSLGARATLQAGAKLVVLYLKTGDQYELGGPCLVRFGGDAPESVDGAAPIKRRPMSGKDGTPIKIRPGALTQAAAVVRSGPGKPVPALSMASTVTLERRPVFRWKEVERGLEYQFVLKDSSGAALFSQTVKGGSLQLPEQIELHYGDSYGWSIGTRSGMGQNYLSQYSFKVADEAMRAMVENYRPADDAAMAEWVAYAAWLDQMGLRDEATGQWTRIRDAGGPVPAARPVPAN